MKSRLLVFIFLLVFFKSKQSSAQDAISNILTLKQCVDIAITNNLQVKQSDLQLQDAATNLKQAKANQLPDLFGNLSHGINQGRSIDPFTNSYVNQQIFFGNYSLSSSVILFNGGQLKNLVKQNSLSYQASKMDLQATKDNLTLNVILAYLQILNNEEQLTQSLAQSALTAKQVQRLEILNKEGAVIPSQYYELRGQLGNDSLAVINNQNALETARLTLSRLMNVAYNKNMQVEKLTANEYAAKYDADPEKIYQSAVAQLAIIKAAEFRRQSADKGVRISRGSFYPVIGLSGGISTNYSTAASSEIFINSVQVPSGDFVTIGGNQVPVITTKSNYRSQKINYFDQFNNNYNTALLLNVRIPIFNSFQAKNRVALAKTQLKNTEYIEQTAKVQLKQSIEEAYFNMSAAYNRYQTLIQQVKDYAEAFRVAEVRFNEGATNQVDYLIAKNNLDRSQNNLIIAKYDYIFRIKILDYYRGKLAL